MKTRIIKIENTLEDLEEAKDLILQGDLVAFPTETVYGLGADGLNPEAVQKIFVVKGRPQDNPLILHVSSVQMLEKLVDADLTIANLLIKKFWPGPLTLVLKKSKLVPDIITAGLDTVAVRMPENKIALSIIEMVNRPIAAPSANLSGRPSPTDAKTCMEDLKGKIPLIIDGGNTKFGLESTVLDLSDRKPTILRPGAITLEMLKEVIANVVVDKGILEKNQVPKSPGQKYKHYAPKAEAYLVSGSDDKKLKKIINFIEKNQDKKIGLMGTSELIEKLKESKLLLIDLGSRTDLVAVSSSIFRALRTMDEEKVDIIICEAVDDKDLGMAIMNRLKKSTANRYIGE